MIREEKRMSVERHFNVTVYIADSATKNFLMIRHRKLRKWLPPGGHIDLNEIPDEAAKREVREETGLNVDLYGEIFPEKSGLIRPYGIQRNIIELNKHEHLDLIYLALVARAGCDVKQNFQETEGIRWYGIEDIERPEFDSFDATKQWCRRFYDMLSKKD